MIQVDLEEKVLEVLVWQVKKMSINYPPQWSQGGQPHNNNAGQPRPQATPNFSMLRAEKWEWSIFLCVTYKIEKLGVAGYEAKYQLCTVKNRVL